MLQQQRDQDVHEMTNLFHTLRTKLGIKDSEKHLVLKYRSCLHRKQQMDKVMEEYEDIFTSPTGVPLHCQVKHPINLTPGAPLPNGPIYRCSVLENDEIKRRIQELL